MEYWRKKTRFNACFLLVAVFIIFGSLTTTSCNARAFVKLDEKGSGATITVNVAFASFFVEYLRDLIGFETFSEMVGIENFREFFEAQPGTSYVSASVSNDPETIIITIKTTNVHTLLSQFEIPFKQEGEKTRIQVTQQLVKTLLGKLPAFEGVDTAALFVADEQVVAKDTFASYIGWALEDYASKASVQKTVEKSYVSIALEKQEETQNIPDEGWKQKNATTQELEIPLVDILYENSYNVWYSQ